jgi:uncharacterized protein YggE
MWRIIARFGVLGPGWIVGMQMVQNPWGVTVHGAASVKAIPDLVRIKFEVNRLEQTPGKAFAVANEAGSRTG